MRIWSIISCASCCAVASPGCSSIASVSYPLSSDRPSLFRKVLPRSALLLLLLLLLRLVVLVRLLEGDGEVVQDAWCGLGSVVRVGVRVGVGVGVGAGVRVGVGGRDEVRVGVRVRVTLRARVRVI